VPTGIVTGIVTVKIIFPAMPAVKIGVVHTLGVVLITVNGSEALTTPPQITPAGSVSVMRTG
jgi:hypothetical protein